MLLIKSLSAFRGMGCTTTTADQVLTTEWEAKRVRRKRPRSGKRRRRHSSAAAADGSPALLPDVWCTPGIALAMDASAVDCVVSKRSRIANRRREGTERALGEVGIYFLFFHDFDALSKHIYMGQLCVNGIPCVSRSGHFKVTI